MGNIIKKWEKWLKVGKSEKLGKVGKSGEKLLIAGKNGKKS